MQTKVESLIENVLNVFTGLVLSIFVVQPLVFPIFNIITSVTENIAIAIIFTLVSIIRGYVWRRIFNKRAVHKLAKLVIKD